MKKAAIRNLCALPLVVSLSGCAIGYNHTLFVTKSNAGLDFDSKPPTAEISIARREGVIEPAFEDGQTLPVLASFKVENSGVSAFFFGLGQTFAGGNAAVTMAKLYGDEDYTTAVTNQFESKLPLRQKPQPKLLGRSVPFPEQGQVRPFLFGTDTHFGLKVAWSGMTGQFPDTVRLGYNRKEFALAPVFGRTELEPGLPYSVKMPSFLATIENATTVGSPEKTGVKHLQYFATGLAAEQLALRQQVRQAMLQRADPLAEAHAQKFMAYVEDQTSFNELVRRILAGYKAQTGDERREAIRKQAMDLNLVTSAATTDRTFKNELLRHAPDEPGVAEQLKKLLEFINTP